MELNERQNHNEEVKTPICYREADEELSEFERARQSSKTWSMGQD